MSRCGEEGLGVLLGRGACAGSCGIALPSERRRGPIERNLFLGGGRLQGEAMSGTCAARGLVDPMVPWIKSRRHLAWCRQNVVRLTGG